MIWKDRVVQHPRRYKLKNIDTGAVVATYDLESDTGTITEEGTPVNAGNMNTIETAIEDLDTSIDDINTLLTKSFLSINKELSNVEAVLDVDSKALQNNGKVYDLLDGTNNYSCGQLDTTNTYIIAAYSSGVATVNVNSVTGFSAGQEVTIQDDAHLERLIISSVGASSLTFTTNLTNAYKKQALVYRSYVDVNTTNKTMKFKAWSHDVATDRSTTPVNIMTTQYGLSGTNGRKLVRLSNGWFIYIMNINTTIYVYKSTDNGGTFTQLCTISGYTSPSYGDIAVVSIGTVVKILWPTGTAVYCNSFDATTVTNSDQNSNKITVDSSQTSIYTGLSAVVDSSNNIHAVWGSKNSTYANSSNIRYSKSTDGGTTWATPTQITTYNTSGVNALWPCVITNSSNNPMIATIYWSSSQYYIDTYVYSGSAWGSVQHSYNLGTYAPRDLCAVADGNNYAHLVWTGLDATYSSYRNIMYGKSTNWGTSWNSATRLTAQNSTNQDYPQIACDTSNNLYVLWLGEITANGYKRLKRIIYSNSSWGSATELTSTISNGIDYLQICNNYKQFTDPICMYCEYGNSKLMFRGTFDVYTAVNLLTTDFRYNTIPPLGTTDELALWLYNEKNAGYTLTGALSIVDTSSNESYSDMTKTTTSLGVTTEENQFLGSVATAQEKVTFRGIITRTSTSIDKSITKVLGGIA